MDNYIDSDGNVIVLKSIRPIVDYPETILGNKRGATRQFRYGNLHIREYDDYYTTHMDIVDPRKDPLGHLLVDAPEYLVGLSVAFSAAKLAISIADRKRKQNDHHSTQSALSKSNNMIPGNIAEFLMGAASYLAVNFMKNWITNDSKS